MSRALALVCAVMSAVNMGAEATSVVHTHNLLEGKILAEELLDSAMMTMRTSKDGEEKLDKHPSLYQQYLAKVKADARRLRAASSVDAEAAATEAMETITPAHELRSAKGPTMRSYKATEGKKMAEAILAKHKARKASIL